LNVELEAVESIAAIHEAQLSAITKSDD